MEEKKNTIDGLLEQGKAAGKLTTKEISDALEEMDFDLDQLNSFYDTCEQLNIEIIDDTAVDPNHLKDSDLDLADDLEAYGKGRFLRQEAAVRSQPAFGSQHCQKVCRPWHAVPGSDSGRKPGLAESS